MAHSLSNVLIHIVFNTKNRAALINHEIQDQLYRYMASICKQNDSLAHIINGVEDHVHILLSLSRKISLGDLVGKIKSNSSRWIKNNGVDYHHFAWQAGYGGFSIAPSIFDQTIMYISKQKKHHQHCSFEDEFIKLLNRYEISYDEKYLWE